jgi:hypothetical protein
MISVLQRAQSFGQVSATGALPPLPEYVAACRIPLCGAKTQSAKMAWPAVLFPRSFAEILAGMDAGWRDRYVFAKQKRKAQKWHGPRTYFLEFSRSENSQGQTP